MSERLSGAEKSLLIEAVFGDDDARASDPETACDAVLAAVERILADRLAALAPVADGGLAAKVEALHAPGPILTHGDECTDEDHEHSPTSHSFGEDMCLDCPRSGEQYCTHCSDFNDDLVPYPCPTIRLLDPDAQGADEGGSRG